MAPNHALLKVRLLHWLELIFLQFERAKNTDSESCYTDTLMFPIVAALSIDALESSIAEGLIAHAEAKPAIDRASEIRLVRNMICHISEYDIERGKFPDQDDRSFDGVFRQSDGRIHIAYRIEILDCVSRFRTVSQKLFAREYWGKGRKPRGT